MTVEIISWSISRKVWDRAGIELATPGSAVRHAFVMLCLNILIFTHLIPKILCKMVLGFCFAILAPLGTITQCKENYLCIKIRIFFSFDSLHPSQQFFSQARVGLPVLNQYLAEDKVSC